MALMISKWAENIQIRLYFFKHFQVYDLTKDTNDTQVLECQGCAWFTV